MSDSGNSSKLEVSSMLLMLMGMAAGRSLKAERDVTKEELSDAGGHHDANSQLVVSLLSGCNGSQKSRSGSFFRSVRRKKKKLDKILKLLF